MPDPTLTSVRGPVDYLVAQVTRPGDDPMTVWYLEALLYQGRRGEIPSIPEAAQRVGISASTLRRRLRAAGYPTPGALLRWGQLLGAMAFYRLRPLPLELVARAGGYSDASSLSRQMLRLTGMRPGAWKEDGGDMFDLLDAMVSTWRDKP